MSAVLTQVLGIGSSVLGNIVTLIPKGKIGSLNVQATLEETMTDTVHVTDHPVEAGAEISDHAYYRPAELVMRCGWSNSSPSNLLGAVGSLFSGGGIQSFLPNLTGLPGLGGSNSESPQISGGGLTVSDYVSGVYAQLLALQQSLTPITVATSIRQYTNMVITSIVLTRDQKTSQALMCIISMRQVIITNTVAASIAPAQNMANPQNTAAQLQGGSQSLQPNASPNPGGSNPPLSWPEGSDEAAAGTPSD